MSNFTFTCDNDGTINTMSFSGEYWPDILENFKQFLRGSGFVFADDIFEDSFDSDVFVESAVDNINDNQMSFDFTEHSPNNWPFATGEQNDTN